MKVHFYTYNRYIDANTHYRLTTLLTNYLQYSVNYSIYLTENPKLKQQWLHTWMKCYYTAHEMLLHMKQNNNLLFCVWLGSWSRVHQEGVGDHHREQQLLRCISTSRLIFLSSVTVWDEFNKVISEQEFMIPIERSIISSFSSHSSFPSSWKSLYTNCNIKKT